MAGRLQGPDDDFRAIEALIRRQFAALSWGPDRPADWAGFAADFAPGATLWAAARPAVPQSVAQFVARMQGLAATSLPRLDERLDGLEIRVFGGIATASAVCALTESASDGATARNLEMMLLVKSDGRWQIVAQAWDGAAPGRPLPADLTDPPA